MKSGNVIGQFKDEIEEAAGEVVQDIKDEVGQMLEQGTKSAVSPQLTPQSFDSAQDKKQIQQKQVEDQKKIAETRRKLAFWQKVDQEQKMVRQQEKQKQMQKKQEEQQEEQKKKVEKIQLQQAPKKPGLSEEVLRTQAEYKAGKGVGG